MAFDDILTKDSMLDKELAEDIPELK